MLICTCILSGFAVYAGDLVATRSRPLELLTTASGQFADGIDISCGVITKLFVLLFTGLLGLEEMASCINLRVC